MAKFANVGPVRREFCPGGCGRMVTDPTVLCGECFATVPPALKQRVWAIAYASKTHYATRRSYIRELLKVG